MNDRNTRDGKSKPLKSSPPNTIYIPYIPDTGDNSIDNPSRADVVYVEDITFNIPPYAYCQPLEHHWHRIVTLEPHDHYDDNNNRTPIERECDEKCVSFQAAEPLNEQVCICGNKSWVRSHRGHEYSQSSYILN